MNIELIEKYCEIKDIRTDENGKVYAVYFLEDGRGYAEFANGEQFSCSSLEDFDLLCETVDLSDNGEW